ncbi:endonuclease/exonuclease/phosphatase family protein [Allorhodopirellula heiligendammensis]|uniref:Endonuclease/exonuclease/phosphatase domain-containing protein n=1 Tax=Allorhodopirellula heiligendammensis TaxID=2714739 RepID=A0A5C6BSG7_9BACT|nr:endonuclease/exonuclease/phosphatase family protein [Allorhodopirellula heiligendammensis]TWU15190.1 hypothetical protein Poly21_23830 [Allorhodopirellula heiligendammensis]
MKSISLSLASLVFAILLSAPYKVHAEDSAPVYQVVTYNIKHGLGNDGKLDLARTAEVISKLNPDFIALQEVDDGTQRSKGINEPLNLAKRLNMHAAFGSFMTYDGGQYGLAILSRYPITKKESIRLPDGNEPRVALAVEVELPTGKALKLVNVHFDWVKDDNFRYAQAEKVCEYLDSLDMPYVVMGDFNDQPLSRTVKLFRERALEAHKPVDDHLTFSSTEPSIEIDFIFAAPRSRWGFDNVNVIDEPHASDHRPVAARLRQK